MAAFVLIGLAACSGDNITVTLVPRVVLYGHVQSGTGAPIGGAALTIQHHSGICGAAA